MLAKWVLRSNEEQSRISQIIINKFDFDHKGESKNGGLGEPVGDLVVVRRATSRRLLFAPGS